MEKLVTFKLTACNWNPRRTTTRVLKELPNGDIEVKHNGWDNFIVHKHEIIKMEEVHS